MIINLHFGYKERHHIYYDTDLKRGTLKLWTSQNGSMHSAPIENDEGFLTGLLTRSEVSGRDLSRRRATYRVSDHR
ncbi:MAG: hypothetical protein QM730_28250 [Anaerolineales bacterium]